ncbi:hypothetical protein DDB_G0276353 [Dictyostelium discoideum AX4]|uniref:Protein tortoise n=1 Tax=Dictyostelium discoideum TaxID=44689 RepID=TORA_DICDI|nr:hypothetical protein DDB_G0276353 [Dictyostelium discoideum AX4]Q8T133.1 RecName: Full=Protein tortoise [Dictyostelium discoideum]EAL69257.1 hypothetical protein DDB_G0276353 [Dictyostelium discoideum AX4]|eukprot:XP_643175.1 hypothetical protein DDB_G0276353 [Dictyostelium discoideum AX4]
MNKTIIINNVSKYIKFKNYYSSSSTILKKKTSEIYKIKGLDIKDRKELYSLNNDSIKKKLNQLKDETNQLLKERGEELMKDLSKTLNLTSDNLKYNITKSPFTLRAYLLAANQGISFYHHELRKQINPTDDYERQKRKDLVYKLQSQEIDSLTSGGANKKKSPFLEDNNNKKSMSIEREMEIIREQQQEQQHFDQQMSNSTKWEMSQLEIQPRIDTFRQDELFVSFNPYESMSTNSQSYQLVSRLSKFVWNKELTNWEMFSSSKLNQLIPQLQLHILDKINLNNDNDNDNSIIINQFLESIKFISNEINSTDLNIFKTLNSSNNNNNSSENIIEVENGGDFKKIINNSIVDSLIYMKGHHFRITSDPFILFFQQLKENQDYFTSNEDYKQFLEKLLDTLLFETIEFDPTSTTTINGNRQFEYKLKLDLLQREAFRQFKVYQVFNTSPDAKRHEESDLRKLAHLCKTLQKRSTSDFIQESKKYLSPQILSNGLLNSNKLLVATSSSNELNQSKTSISISQLTDGLHSCIPATMSLLEFSIKNSSKDNILFDTFDGKLKNINSLDDLITKFANSKYIYLRESLSQRFSMFIQSSNNTTDNNTTTDTNDNDIIIGLNNPIYKLLIDLEDKVLELSQNNFEENPIENWIGCLSIELGDEDDNIEYKDTDQFNVIASQNFNLVRINNQMLAQLHKTFSEDLDFQIEELELMIKNKKILEREIKAHNEKISKIIKDSRDSTTPTFYFIGIQDDQVYTLEIPNEWEPVWNLLKSYPNGLLLKDFIDKQTFVTKEAFLSTLTDLNKYGVVGLFPKN